MTAIPHYDLQYCRSCEHYLPCVSRFDAPRVGACLRQMVVRDFDARACCLFRLRREPQIPEQ